MHKFTQNSDQTSNNFQVCQNRIAVITANDFLQAIIEVNPLLLTWKRGVRVRCLTIFSSVSECSSLSASRKLRIVGLVQMTILLKPLWKSVDGGIPLVPSKLVEEEIQGSPPNHCFTIHHLTPIIDPSSMIISCCLLSLTAAHLSNNIITIAVKEVIHISLSEFSPKWT